MKRVGQRLSDTFRLLLEGGDLQIILNGSPLKPRSLGEIARKDFRVRAAAAMVGGWVGTVDPTKRTADFVPGLRCYRLGRLVKDGEFFGHPIPAQEPGMAQLIGEVEIPRVPLTINKSDFDRGQRTVGRHRAPPPYPAEADCAATLEADRESASSVRAQGRPAGTPLTESGAPLG